MVGFHVSFGSLGRPTGSSGREHSRNGSIINRVVPLSLNVASTLNRTAQYPHNCALASLGARTFRPPQTPTALAAKLTTYVACAVSRWVAQLTESFLHCHILLDHDPPLLPRIYPFELPCPPSQTSLNGSLPYLSCTRPVLTSHPCT